MMSIHWTKNSSGASGGGARRVLRGSGLMSRPVGGGVGVVRISSKGQVYVGVVTVPAAREDSFARPYLDAIDIKTGKKTRSSRARER